ncbi:peptidase M13 [Thalassotalea sp. M1531]|uniref:Peptidase M13 n=1 Tax=Thalassotalea algicola TaxID=2716224 RepID=A0A7Y0LBQ8_9GAMM|nr:M13-type metalloendopeptidase [Thalassotalea algicola]NMP31304.1 peptidase M13 [Thalassotalea algicola]
MKTILTTAVCSSLLLLSGCNSTDQALQKVQQETGIQHTALASGVSKANMDLTIRPQDNFYRYVNGGWLKRNEIPGDKTTIGSFYDLRDDADKNVKAIIEELASTPNLKSGSDEQKVADLFRSYMDQETRNGLGITPIQSILTDINALKSKQDLMEFFGKYQSVGVTSPLYLYISVDAKDSSRYATHVWQGGLGLPDKDYYFNEAERFANLRAGYKAHIAKMFELSGFAEGDKAAEAILALETQMADHHWTRVQSRDSEKRYNKFDVSELDSVSENIDWQAYLAAQGVAKQTDLIVNQPDFVEGLGKIIKSTSIADWKIYLKFHTLSTFASYLTTDLDKENFEFFSKQLNGRKEQRPQWKRGVSVVNSNLGEVIGKVYVSRHFTPEAKSRMSVLVENLRSAYGSSIDELEWMSADTKKQAHVKLAAFTPKIGYPDKWEDYSSLTIKGNDLIGNIMRSGKVSHHKDVEKLGGPIRKWEWGMTPQTVNAYYNPTVNEIVFPAAILQPPFFNMEADDAVNYGGIGAVIGHEMGHGFDDQGSRYDAEGNLKNWWTEEDLAEFTKRAGNLVKQYDGYQVFEDLHVNGKLTLGENIGDLSGLTIAYKAYKASLNGKKAPVIDNLTGDQRFFMGFAQIWRAKYVEKALRNRVATDSHSPAEFRAIGSLSNMDEFYEAFGVKEGDAMYIAPEKRVKIW